MRRIRSLTVLGLCFSGVITSAGWSEVVRFRLEATDMAGDPLDAVTVGSDFLITAHVQHTDGFSAPDVAGVYAAFLDIHYDASIASVAGPMTHGDLYQIAKRGDVSTPGLLDNVGAVSSSGGWGLDPIGLEEQWVFSVPMRADAVGAFSFSGSAALSDLFYDILVYGWDEPVPPGDIDFGGPVVLDVLPVPEPHGWGWLAWGLLVGMIIRSRVCPQTRVADRPQ